MKRIISIFVVAVICACVSAQTKLSPEVFHFVSLHGDLGYSALYNTAYNQNTASDVNPTIRKAASGINPAIGADYRLYYNHFLFSVGIEAMYQLNAYHISRFNDTIRMQDTEGDPFNMIVKTGKPRDLTHTLNINIPVLFGGEWGRFYFLVGPKVSFNILNAASSHVSYETYAKYDWAYDDWRNIPDHQLEKGQTMSFDTLSPMSVKIYPTVHLEIGGRIGHMFKHKQFRINPDRVRMYLAAYVDCGLDIDIFNAHSSADKWYSHGEVGKPLNLTIRPVKYSDLVNGTNFLNFNVGIKYTIAFEMPKHGKSYVYDYDNVERDYRKRGGNQTLKD